MTKEELEKEAEDIVYGMRYDTYDSDGHSDFAVQDTLVKFAEPREKRIAELEEKISVLLSCKNCTENKGGYICEKEYEDRCLAQKIQYIKELQEEIAELEGKQKWLGSSTKCWFRNAPCRSCDEHDERLKLLGLCYIGQLDKAMELLREIIDTPVFTQMDGELYENKSYTELVEEAEQFIKEIKEK